MADKEKKADRVKEQPATYETYAAMPDDGNRYEVIEGRLELLPSPSPNHQLVRGQLQYRMHSNCESEYIVLGAPLDVILSDVNVLQPDLILVHRSRKHILTHRGVEGPPDLVVEILTPGTRNRDKAVKMKIYAAHGVSECWIVEPEARVIELFRLESGRYEPYDLFEGDEVVTSDKLPCISFAISDIFRDMLH